MPEERNRATPDRQATWVALRTLRQRPTVAGQTEDGATVYEIRAVRLVLPQGSPHFKRLMPCAKCGRDVPGAPVLSPADLDQVPNPIFCDRCVRSPASPRPEVHRQAADLEERAPTPVSKGQPSLQPEPDPEYGRRLAGVEAQLAKVMSQLPPPVDDGEGLQQLSEKLAGVLLGQNAELAKMAASVAEVQAQVSELATQLADVRAGVAAMVEASTQPLHAALAEGLSDMRAQLAALPPGSDDGSTVRSDIVLLAEASRQLAENQTHLDQRMRDLAGQLAMRSAADPDGIPAQDLAALRADVADTIGADAAHLRAELAEALDLLRAEIVALEQRSRDELAAVTAMLGAQREELTEALHDVAHETLMSVAEPLRDLTRAREDFERRLEGFHRRAEADARRVEALNAKASAGASRLHALEQRLHVSVQRLIHPAGPASGGQERPPASPVQRHAPGALMDSLERQLRAAEERLSDH